MLVSKGDFCDDSMSYFKEGEEKVLNGVVGVCPVPPGGVGGGDGGGGSSVMYVPGGKFGMNPLGGVGGGGGGSSSITSLLSSSSSIPPPPPPTLVVVVFPFDIMIARNLSIRSFVSCTDFAT